MGLLDDPVIRISGHIVAAIVEFSTVFWIYVIWKHSTQTMAKFKVFLLKMAISDLMFSVSLSLLLEPNLLLPLPASGIFGPMQYLGKHGGKYALIITVVLGASTLISVNDCCISRCMIMYGQDNMLKHFTGLRGIIYFIALYGLVIGVVSYLVFCYSCSYETLFEYAKRNHKLEYLDGITADTAIIAFDLDDPNIVVGGSVVISALIFMEGLNISLSSAVQHRINKARNSMSKETFKMQRSFTAFLIAHATIPFVSITAPCVIYLIAFFADWKVVYNSKITESTAIILIVAYPLVNCACCFALIRPYKMFLIYCVRRLLPWLFPQPTAIDHATLFSFSTSTNTMTKGTSSRNSNNKY